MQEWKMQDQYTRAENAGLESVVPICRGGNCRTGKYGKRHCICMENHLLLMSPAKCKYSSHRVMFVASVATVSCQQREAKYLIFTTFSAELDAGKFVLIAKSED